MSQTNVSPTRSRAFRRVWVWGGGILIAGFVLLQTVRFIIPEFQLDNPPVTHQTTWNSPETAQLWDQACAACHSNETVYPWYSYIAPVGWLVAHDTHEGREALNISEDSRVEWDEMIEVIEEGEMPPSIYVAMHPDANLNNTQREALIAGIRTTFR